MASQDTTPSGSAPPSEKQSFSGVSRPRVDIEAVDGDAVFGAQGKGHVQYTSMNWVQTTIILIKTQVGLGVLAMPTALQALGGVPGTIIIVGLGIVTTWCDYRNHPEVYSMSDVGFVLYGRAGREFFAAAYGAFMVMLIGAAMVPISIAFNTLTEHATCTVAWVVLAAVVTFALASIQTLNKVSIIGWFGVICILAAVLIVTVSVGVQDRPAAAPPTGPWDKDIHAVKAASYWAVVEAISTVLFGYCGTPAFFSVISEMKNPGHYNRALYTCQSIVVSTYSVIGIVVYVFCGQYLSSPALGSAGPLLKKISYGIALPGMWASAVIFCHCAAKLIFVRMMRNSRHLTALTFTHWAVWLSIVAGCTAIAFVLAMAIPFFGSLVVLIGALFGTTLCLQAGGWMWLHDNWHRRRTDRSVRFWAIAAASWLLIAFGTWLMVSGVVAACLSIRDQYRAGTVPGPFNCADNS